MDANDTKGYMEHFLGKIQELEGVVNDLREKVTKLEKCSGNTPSKKNSKKRLPSTMEEYIENANNKDFSCAHWVKTGVNKNKFCNSKTGLVFDNQDFGSVDQSKITDWQVWHLLRCSTHNKGTNNANIDLGKKIFQEKYGKLNEKEDEVITAKDDEESASEATTSLLTGNTINVITTPTKALAKSVRIEHVIQGDFIDTFEKVGDTNVVIRYKSGKNFSETNFDLLKRPSPTILGVLKNIENKEDYLDHLIEPSDTIISRVGFKYKALSMSASKEIKLSDEEDLDQGLSSVKLPVVQKEDDDEAYNAETEDENDENTNNDKSIEDLLDNLE